MASWLVAVVVTSEDNELGERVASAVADLTHEVASVGEGECDVWIGDPVRVTP